MNKVQRVFAVIALAVALLGGLVFPGLGSVANAASIHNASTAFGAGQLASTSGPRIFGPCPRPGWEC